MLPCPYFAKCFDTPKTEERKGEELRAWQQHEEGISSLPLQQAVWLFRPLRLYKGFWLPDFNFPGVLSIRSHLRPAPSDIFLASYPKSGTTWLKAIAFAISTRSPNSLLSRHPHDCSPFLETLFSGPQIPDLDGLPSPRLLSTHLPYSILPKSVHNSPCRIIYVCRELKDTLVSLYHFLKEMRPEVARQNAIRLEEGVDLFCKGLSGYGPVWEHQLEYWKASKRLPDKVLFVKYEDMKAYPEASVRRMAEFMGMAFTAEEEMSGIVGEIVRVTSFEKLSALEVNKVGINRGVIAGLEIKNSSFFRKGKVGDWKEHLTAERVDAVTRDKLHQSGLTYSC